MCQSTTTPAPAWGNHPYQRAYEVAGIVSDARHLASAIAELVPDSIHSIRVDELTRIQHFASAVARLMEGAENACDALASDLQGLQFSNQQGS